MIDFYNKQRTIYQEKSHDGKVKIEDIVSADPQKISWTRGLKQDAVRNKVITFDG